MSTHFHVSGTGVTGPLAGLRSHYKWWVLVTAIFGAFVSILDITIVNTALPQIQRAFGSDLHVASYVATAYTLAQGVLMAASGFLANRFGIKRMYLLSLALFTLGSVLCGIAWNINILILFRVLQGAGGAALFPLSFSLVFGAFPEEQRGLANGIFGIPVLVAPALGPVIGGYLAQYVDWRWIFYLNLPIGIMGIIICWRMLHESLLQRTLPFDLRGFLLIASGLGLLLFGLSNLAYDGWGSLLTVTAPSILALLLLAAYIPIELRTAQPLLDLRLFKRRTYLVGSLITWVAFACLFGSTFLLPQYLGLTRLIVISSWIAAGPTRAGLDGGNHCGRLALQSSGRASSRDHGSDCRGSCYLSDESMVVAHLTVCRVDPTSDCTGIWTPFSSSSNEHRRLDRH